MIRRTVRVAALVPAALLALAQASPAAEGAQGPVKVFILAGQSNMEGKGAMRLAEAQSEAPETKDFYAHLKKDGAWVVRDDVWINFLDRRGSLTVGFGSPKCIGPELEFGIQVGNHFQEQVLLIKTAWGGRSLGQDFLPPGARQPTDDELRAMVEKENENNRKNKKPEMTMEAARERYGKTYREMMKEVATVLAELGQRFPAYKGQGYEIAGFVWFQGWNDLINPQYADAHAANLEALIRDVRKDLKAPKLPVVIGQNGQNGFKKAEGGMAKVKEAQAAMERVPDFRGSVKTVATDVFWDADADKLIDNWQRHKEAWDKVGNDYGYHYLGSARTFCRIGRAFGEAMVELLKTH
jgi:alpha-galactosidase